jgi:hypothetical protein
MIPNRNKTSRAGRIVPMFATAIVLSALMTDQAFFKKPPAEAEAYHTAVRSAVTNIASTWGSWLGVEVPVPQAAVKMLHPNIIISRRYQNIATEQKASILLVHVKDARDLIGHYPPICYPGQGWKMQSATEADWPLSNGKAQGTEYVFSRDEIAAGSRIIVDNFFVLRGGIICRNMDDVELAAQDRSRKFFGAAQVQLIHEGNTSPHSRQKCVEELLRVMEPALAVISATGTPDQTGKLQ